MATVRELSGNGSVVDAPAGVIGTFRATGTSTSVSGQFIEVTLRFGTGSVDIEKQMPSGEWIKIETAVVADYGKVLSSPAHSAIRLNCTSYTAAIEYAMKSGTRNA